MSDRVSILEVGPRDGLQNESQPIPTDVKLRFIGQLADCGLDEIEATSFVSPKWVPQLADAEALWPQLPGSHQYSALVPNLKGLHRAIDVGVTRIALFTGASEAFTLKNINMTIKESLSTFESTIREFRTRVANGWVRGYISTAFECPYSGLVEIDQVMAVARQLLEMGIDELSIADTIGVAVPAEVKRLAKELTKEIPQSRIAFHFHDTRGTAIANVAAALDLGFRRFDSSAAGLGGCPYAPGAAGNLATDDLVYFLERSGIETGVDRGRLAKASLEVLAMLGRPPGSKGQLSELSASAPCST